MIPSRTRFISKSLAKIMAFCKESSLMFKKLSKYSKSKPIRRRGSCNFSLTLVTHEKNNVIWLNLTIVGQNNCTDLLV